MTDRLLQLRRALLGLAILPALAACAAPAENAADATHGRVGPRLADAMLRAGDAGAALQVADLMLASDPQDADAHARRGRALLALGRPGEAAEDLAEAARQRPGELATQSALAAARAAAGDSVAAESAWRAVLAGRPADRQARIGLAIALDLQERHAEAQGLYRGVLRDRPDDPTALADLGLSLALSGQPQEALGYLQRPGLPAGRARHDLAVALVLAGDEGGARSVLSQDMEQAEVSAAIESVRALARS